MNRRSAFAWLAALAATGSAVRARAAAHDSFGPVQPPLAAPVLPLLTHDGRRTRLDQELRGHVTAVQLMFTGCSAVCPLQGALFGTVAAKLARAPASTSPGPRLLSLSIDPRADDPRALSGWLSRHGATPAWRAAAPAMDDVDRLLDTLRARVDGADRHTGQVFVFDRRARLVYRTTDLPSSAHVLQVLQAATQAG